MTKPLLARYTAPMLTQELVANVFAKVKRETVEYRWLKGQKYTLIKRWERGKKPVYQWHTDQGLDVGHEYFSLDMADVHFGEGFGDDVAA